LKTNLFFKLRTLINQHAQKPGVRSYREMVSELFYATGDTFAFVKVYFLES